MEDSVKDESTHNPLHEESTSPDQGAPQTAVTSHDQGAPQTAVTSPEPTAQTSEHDTRPYEQRTRDELRLAAKERNIAGRGSMNKAELIEALLK